MENKNKEIDNNIPLILNNKEYAEAIIGEGNCFYRCLSMHIDKVQENHKYHRKIINSYILQNKEAFKHFFEINPDESEEEYNII